MFNSLRARLFLTYLAVILATIVVIAAGLAVFLSRNPMAYRHLYSQQTLALQIMQRRLAASPHATPALLTKESQRIAEAVDARVLVLSPNGNIISDTAPHAPALQLPHLHGHAPQHGTVRDAQGHRWVYSARPMPGNVWALIAHPLPSRASLLLRNAEDWLLPLAEAGLLAIALALALAWWLSRWIARPLHHTAEAARALAEGHYQPVPADGPQEARLLAQAFNDMARRVEASQRSQRDFVANVSHELKTPLTSIQGFAQAIVDGTASDTASIRNAAQIIADEASRMHRLVRILLDLARLDAGTADLQHEAVDVSALLHAIIARFQPQAEQAQTRLTLETEPDLIITGDSDRLSQVFINLLDNALKHTPQGEVHVRAFRTPKGVEIRIQDTGEGIPTEILPRIFERFYRGDKARSGGENAGLGLAIAQEIIRAHGGQITAESIHGQGSVFVVKLPNHPPDAPASPPSQP